MHYIIFGAGDDGKNAMDRLGWERCAYFYDNHKAGEIVQKRRVLNFEQLREKYTTGHYIIVVASSKYQTEMKLFLEVHGMKRFFVFSDAFFSEIWRYRPRYILYGEVVTLPFSVVLMHYNIRRYSHIAISSINSNLPYVISEVAFQCQAWRIDCIIDESVEPGVDASYMGIPCRPLSEVADRIDCLLLNASCQDTGIRDSLPVSHSYDVIDCFDVMRFVPAYKHPDLKRFKGCHEGKRCFIIGNGPSLRMSDLDLLEKNGEITFGVNEIFRAFNQTIWRPSYYCAPDVDGRYFPEYDIYHYVDRDKCVAFYGDPIHWNRVARVELTDRDCIHVEQANYESPVHMPPFSSDICAGVWGGHSVLYCCIQIAAYMGMKEIYLLGADFNFDDMKSEDECLRNHFTEEYTSDEIKRDYAFDLMEFGFSDIVASQQVVRQAFRKAEKYSRAHGFRIYNATRGGKLEEFERVDFDSLFSK